MNHARRCTCIATRTPSPRNPSPRCQCGCWCNQRCAICSCYSCRCLWRGRCGCCWYPRCRRRRSCCLGGGTGGGWSGRANLRQHAWPSRTPSPGGGDILARIIKVLHQRVDLGLFTILIKIRAHWGEFLNKKADRWDDKGRDDVGNLQWDGPCSHSTFSWTEAGVEHRCSMNKFLRAGVHLKVGLFATVSLQELYT